MYEEAIKALRDTVNMEPNNPLYQFHLGRAYAQMGDDAKARAALNHALKLAPDFPDAAEAKQVLASLVY
jgi:Flp pilus assembly protein TadD